MDRDGGKNRQKYVDHLNWNHRFGINYFIHHCHSERFARERNVVNGLKTYYAIYLDIRLC